ncbi:retrovirus-related pol polyprotein from transposon TNT 1-94 [Tanacetum coccineum]
MYVCPAVGSTYADIMANMNIPANDAPVEQAPAVVPPTRMDDQILPLSKWVPIGKSNNVLDVHKPQRNPIFTMAVALLKNANFFRAFTTSSTIPAIYIHQFWDTMCFNSSIGLYSCQLDEQWTGSPLHYSHEESILNTLRFVGKDGREIFGMPIPDALLTDEIKGAPYYEESSYCFAWKEKDRFSAYPKHQILQIEEPAHDDEEADLQRALELSLKEQGEQTQGPSHPMVLREPNSEKFQPLPEVQAKRKEKVIEEQAAHDLLTLHTPKKKSPTEQFIFQRCPLMPTKSSTHDESPSIDAELNLTDNEIEFDEEAFKINARNQEES